MVYHSEEEFLAHYDSTQFEKLSLTTDILIFSVSSGLQESYRKLSDKYFSLLLVYRDNYPFKDKWCLPGGFVRIDESIDAAATRILTTETNLSNIYLEQLYTYGQVDRDPRMRIISTAYMALIDKNRYPSSLTPKACWYNISVVEQKDQITVKLHSEQNEIVIKAEKHFVQEATDRYEYKIIENESLAFDHATVILEGINRIKNKLSYTDIVFHMMPQEFTLKELQQVYEVILNKKLLDPAFRRIIADKVEKTGRVQTGGGHRPSALFCYKKKR